MTVRTPWRTTAATAAVATFVALTSGCSSGDDPETGGTGSADPSRSVGPAAPREPLMIGESVDWQGSRTTVTGIRRAFGGDEHAPDLDGQEWLGLRVRTCAGDDPVEAAWYRFAAYGPTSERYPGASWQDDSWPRPQYPQGEVEAGKCGSGWVLIPVVAGAPVQTVRYDDPDGLPLGEWTVPAGAR